MPPGSLTLPGTDPVRWCKKYGIEPRTVECSRCHAPAEMTIPFRCGKQPGLVAPNCSVCGNDSMPWCIILPRDITQPMNGLPLRKKGKRRKAKVLPFRGVVGNK